MLLSSPQKDANGMRHGFGFHAQPQRHDGRELVRTKTVKISVEKRQITDSSSMGELWKPIRQSWIVDETNSLLLDRVENI